MTCAENERLFDAYLDGQLSGTLRLEFDAHRLRCRRCQQTLAMLESCTHVIAADCRSPNLADSFTEDVMASIAAREADRARPRRIHAARMALVVGGVLQAAAVVILAVMLQSKPAPNAPPGSDLSASPVRDTLVAQGDVRDFFYDAIEQALVARKRVYGLTEQGRRALAYLNLDVPEAVARASNDPVGFNPLTGWIDLILPDTADNREADDQAPSQFAL